VAVRVISLSPSHRLIRACLRIDVGHSGWPLQQQLLAIKALGQSPFAQDTEDFASTDFASPDVDLPAPRSSKSPMARDVVSAPKCKPKQTILSGTAMRDVLLRAFQEDFVPYDSYSSAINADVHAVVPHGTQPKPTDIDATAVPTDRSPDGILARNQLIQSWTRRFRDTPLLVEGDPELELNPSQTKAIAMMLGERLSLVQGVGPVLTSAIRADDRDPSRQEPLALLRFRAGRLS